MYKEYEWHAREALALHDGCPSALYALSWLHRQVGRTDDADALLSAAVKVCTLLHRFVIVSLRIWR